MFKFRSRISLVAFVAIFVGLTTSCNHNSSVQPSESMSINEGVAKIHNIVCSYAHSSDSSQKACLEALGEAWNEGLEQLSDDELSMYELCKKTGMIEARVNACAENKKVVYKGSVNGVLPTDFKGSIKDELFCSLDQLCNADAKVTGH